MARDLPTFTQSLYGDKVAPGECRLTVVRAMARALYGSHRGLVEFRRQRRAAGKLSQKEIRRQQEKLEKSFWVAYTKGRMPFRLIKPEVAKKLQAALADPESLKFLQERTDFGRQRLCDKPLSELRMKRRPVVVGPAVPADQQQKVAAAAVALKRIAVNMPRKLKRVMPSILWGVIRVI